MEKMLNLMLIKTDIMKFFFQLIYFWHKKKLFKLHLSKMNYSGNLNCSDTLNISTRAEVALESWRVNMFQNFSLLESKFPLSLHTKTIGKVINKRSKYDDFYSTSSSSRRISWIYRNILKHNNMCTLIYFYLYIYVSYITIAI